MLPLLWMTLFIVAASKNSKTRLKKEASSPPFWQMSCPQAEFWVIPKYSESWGQVFRSRTVVQIQKNGKIQKSQPAHLCAISASLGGLCGEKPVNAQAAEGRRDCAEIDLELLSRAYG